MRRARLTWKGAFHHVMARCIEDISILRGDILKTKFLEQLKESTQRYRIRIFAYCLMDNHYHIVLENTTDRMADFMKLLNGSFGNYFRKTTKTRGYVFQDRFKSTLIEDDSYLMQAILYVLRNPVEAGIVDDVGKYPWSSIGFYFKAGVEEWVDAHFVEELFDSRNNMFLQLQRKIDYDSQLLRTKWGDILGRKAFFDEAVKKYDRRKKGYSQKRKREDDIYFAPVERVIQEFTTKHNLKTEQIEVNTLEGKRMRAELLVGLKDLAGLKYSEIAEFDIFSDLKPDSLRSIYRNHTKKKK